MNLVEEAMEAEEDEVDKAPTEEADEAVDNSETLLAILSKQICKMVEDG